MSVTVFAMVLISSLAIISLGGGGGGELEGMGALRICSRGCTRCLKTKLKRGPFI